MIIELNGIAIEIIKKPIKNMCLRIYPPDGTVKVSAPMHYKEQLIREFLQKKSRWIIKQRNRIKEHATINQSILRTGSNLLFKGERYLLVIQEHDDPPHIHLHEGFIYGYFPNNPEQELINRVLDHWYKKEMDSILPSLIKKWELIIGVTVAQWGVKKMSTRWGSCNTRSHRIWLNLNLIKKPLPCLEYVLVHELIHLLEASHNQRFYKLMDHFLPEWRDYDYLLEGKKTRKG
jgi:predicted metal-dependent hydrolase